ncbi:hypothetical protein pipiens_014934 [Culex pipiens pipiens]|uniref:Aminopeptidase N-like N-terminal domain-containing protein n=1 Tax=Culex pipiens pipiens TaxID=38569 RepID=A0ABD1CUL7_CULPP
MAPTLWPLLALLPLTAIATTPAKLPRDCLPEHYELRIETTDSELSTFSGSVQINLKCHVDTSRIVLHWKNQFIYEEDTTLKQVNLTKTTVVKVAGISFERDRDWMQVELVEKLKKGSFYVLTVVFTSTLESAGLHRASSFGNDSQMELRWIVVSRFYPYNAHTFFPCFDEPDLEATFNLTLIYDQRFSGICNMELLQEYSMVKELNNYTVQKYAGTKLMAPYQLAFSLNDLTEVEECDELHFNIYGYSDGNLSDIEYAINHTAVILQFYEDTLGLMWKTENLSLISTPGFSLEYSGAAGLLGVPYTVDRNDNEELIQQLARGLMRHLLFDGITLKSWSDLWFIEGFAWYYGYEAWKYLLPRHDTSGWYEGCWTLLSLDMLNSSGSLVDPRLPLEEMGQKAFCTFQTIAQMIGPANFLNESKAFVNGIFGGVFDIQAFADSFISTNKMSNPTMKELLGSWLNGSGVAVVNVTRSANTTTLQVNQLGNSTGTTRWIQASSNSQGSIWIGSKQISTKVALLDPLNPDNIFYYKILYDRATYRSIADQLTRAKRDSAVTLAQLINDAMDFAWYGHTEYSVALEMLLGLTPSEKKLQTLIATWACRLGSSNCSSTARKLFLNIDQVPDHLLGVVLRESARSGNQTEWFLIQGMYTKSTTTKRLVHAVRAIGSFAQTSTKALELINGHTSFVQPHHKRILLETMLEEVPNPLLLHGTLLLEYHNIDESIRRHVLRKMAQRMVLADDLLVLQKLAGRYQDAQAVDVTALQDAIEITQQNLEWLKGRSAEFLAALKRK